MLTNPKASLPMRRWSKMVVLVVAMCGCGGDGDADDVAEQKTPLPMDKVPAAVLKTAKAAAPDLTFFAAYTGKHDGKDSIELKGKSKTGKITEVEVSPDGTLLGTE